MGPHGGGTLIDAAADWWRSNPVTKEAMARLDAGDADADADADAGRWLAAPPAARQRRGATGHCKCGCGDSTHLAERIGVGDWVCRFVGVGGGGGDGGRRRR